MKKILLLLSCFSAAFCFAQVSVNTDGSVAGANTMLDVKSTNKGVQFPRITTAQRKAISTTTDDIGLMVFDTDKSCLYGFNGTEWVPFAYAGTAPGAVIKKNGLPANQSVDGDLGTETAIDGAYAAVGVPRDTVNGVGYRGSVYIYQRTGSEWTVMTRLIPPTPETASYFGKAISVNGDYIAIGCYGDDVNGKNNQGSVYIYLRSGNTWNLQQKLTMPVATVDAYFGTSVGLDGTNLIVGATGVAINGKAGQGTTYVFSRIGTVWSQTAQITADDGAAGDYFGGSVAMEGDYIVIGAQGGKVANSSVGAAYIYVKGGGTWTKQQRLISNDPHGNAYFGNSVDIHNNIIAIGSWEDWESGFNCGQAYTFKRTGNQWSLLNTYTPQRVEGAARFGWQVKLAGEYLLISAPWEDALDAKQSGAVYVYRWNGLGYQRIQRLIMPGGPNGAEYFGNGLSFDGISFLIGAPNMQRTSNSTAEGAVFFGSVD